MSTTVETHAKKHPLVPTRSAWRMPGSSNLPAAASMNTGLRHMLVVRAHPCPQRPHLQPHPGTRCTAWCHSWSDESAETTRESRGSSAYFEITDIYGSGVAADSCR
eukprot:4815413-Pyramimonas_sp.AAC.1